MEHVRIGKGVTVGREEEERERIEKRLNIIMKVNIFYQQSQKHTHTLSS